MMNPPTKVTAAWLVVLCMTGCPATDDDMPSSDSGADSGGTGAETETATDASPSSSGEEPLAPWSDVECDMEVCEGSDICFKPASYCSGPCVDNYQDLVNPPRRCEPIPAGCDPSDPIPCFFDALCDAGEEGQLSDGQLTCYGAADCYCR